MSYKDCVSNCIIVIQRIQELEKAVMEIPAPSPKKAADMSTEEVCQWLKERKIADNYIELFRENDVDGSVLADYTDEDLKELGIPKQHIRKKIISQFKKISSTK